MPKSQHRYTYNKFHPISVHTLYKQLSQVPYILSTGCQLIDKLLGGGIHSNGGIYEFVGEAGVGKTQLIYQLCIQCQLYSIHGGLNGAVIYINTESSMRTDRLQQMASEMSKRHPWMLEHNNSEYNWLEYILHYQVNSIDELDNAIHIHVNKLLNENNNDDTLMPIKLIVIDSIASVFRTDRHDNYNTIKSTRYNNINHDKHIQSTIASNNSDTLFKISNKLKQLSAQYKLSVVILNQVSDLFIDNTYNNYTMYVLIELYYI